MTDRTKPRLVLALFALALLVSVQAKPSVTDQSQGLSTVGLANGSGPALSPTLHPPVPELLDAMWYAPAARATAASSALSNLAQGVRMLEQTGDAATALPLVTAQELATSDVAFDAQFYAAIALHRLNRSPEADAILGWLSAQEMPGYLPEAAALRRADGRETVNDYAGALAIYESLIQRKLSNPASAWLRLGMMAEMSGNRERARQAFRYVYETFLLTQEGNEAELGLLRVDGLALDNADAVAKELKRAHAQFAARRTTPARSGYERLRSKVNDDDRDLVAIRLAALDALDGRLRPAHDTLRRYVAHQKYGVEAQFALLAVTRDLNETIQYRSAVRAFVDAYPTSSFAEEALNELATHYVRADEDAKAAEIFREIVDRFPSGKYSERAAWKAGWWAYRQRDFANTVRMFERGAATFPRSDYRPAWLYWSARAYDGMRDSAAATDRYRLTATDYLNTYYGRLAWKRLEARNEASVTPGIRRTIVPPPPPPPTVDRIARLIELELYHPALAELLHAQRTYGDSAPLQATIAFVQHKLGNLRLGINAMKRAYPQYMTAGGENLPLEILQVIYPLDYWPMIQTLAQQHDLDPYLVAALVGQESTFDAGIVSSANAIGLMQVMPPTGRDYAKKIGITPFSVARLTEPEVNARIGTRYLSELIRMFEGKSHFAIASYNAGENRVAKWRRDKPELEQEEFIDDIPYPETQNYVKRILGTAEDYRRLYGNGMQPAAINRSVPGKSLPTVAPVKTPTTAKKSTTAKKVTPTTKKKVTTKKATATKKKATAKKPLAKK